MRYLTLGEVVALHRAILAATGGADGIRELHALKSALAQSKATFDDVNLYPTVVDKASALAFGLAIDHPFRRRQQADRSRRDGRVPRPQWARH